jgi:GNAT superfamily N-acetyltransferase
MSSPDRDVVGGVAGGRDLRLAADSDLPAIRGLVQRAYAKYADRMDQLPRPVRADYVAEQQAGQIWVVGEPIAGVIVLIREPDCLLIENVAIDPAAQGTGLGRLLMEFAQEQAISTGLNRLRLYTHEVMTENLAIYLHLGYHETERRSEDGYHRIFMSKAL